ncbi:hypothetical protein Tco_1096452 [Tanacetum coccineum]
MLWGSPPMKASISFSEFGTMFRHKTANSWNLLISSAILIGQEPFQFSPGISHGPVFLLGLSAFVMAAACASRAAAMPSVISCRMAAKVMAGVSDVDGMIHNDEDGDNDANDGDDDEREISWK